MIDVLVLNKDYGRFLNKSLNSVISQTYKDINLLVADDNSTDNSREIINTFNCQKIFIDDNNPNIAKTRNILISHATSDFIVFLSSDDYFKENFLEVYFNELKNTDKTTVGVYGNFDWVDVKGNKLSTRTTLKFPDKKQLNIEARKPRNVVPFESCIFKKEIFQQGVKFNPDILHGEETHFIAKATEKYYFKKLSSEESFAFKTKHEKQGHTEFVKNRKQWINKIRENL